MKNEQREGTIYHGSSMFQWPTGVPSDAGLDEGKLEEARAFAAATEASSLLVLRNGTLVSEDYWQGNGAGTVQQTFSGTKSVFSLLVGRLIDQGVLASLGQGLGELVEELSEELHQLTIENVMAMQTGLVNSPEIEGLGQTGMTQLEIALTREVEAAPFTSYYYNNAAYRLLFTALERASGKSLETLTAEEVFEPLGFDGAYWVRLYAVDGDNEIFRGYQSIRMTPRDFAKSSQVIVDEGNWCGSSYLSPAFVKRLVISPRPAINPSFGLYHHLNAGEFHRRLDVPERIDRKLIPGAPDDTFLMHGAGGQATVGIPSLNLVIVRTGTGNSLYEPENPVAVLARLVVEAAAG